MKLCGMISSLRVRQRPCVCSWEVGGFGRFSVGGCRRERDCVRACVIER